MNTKIYIFATYEELSLEIARAAREPDVLAATEATKAMTKPRPMNLTCILFLKK